MQYLDITPIGDSAVVVKLAEQVNLDAHYKVKQLSDYLDTHPFIGMVEYVPAFTSVTIYYDPTTVYLHQYKEMKSHITYPYDVVHRYVVNILDNINEHTLPQLKVVELPVYYGGDCGVDLPYVAKYNGLTEQEVISIHTSGEYIVYMLGFAPGFPYLGGMDRRIAAPRKDTPRLRIPQGTVGIAGEQTGVYPLETPGGWQLIGRTPVPLFLPEKEPPTLLEAGNIVKFYSISRTEYDNWGK